MLEVFKIMNPGREARRVAADELTALINAAREERGALSEILTQVTLRSGKLIQTRKSLELVEQKAADATGKLDEMARRIASLDDRTTALETQASLDTLEKYHAALECLRAELQQTQLDLKASLDQTGALKTDLDQLRAAVSETDEKITVILAREKMLGGSRASGSVGRARCPGRTANRKRTALKKTVAS